MKVPKDSRWIWGDDTRYEENHWLNIRRVFHISKVCQQTKFLISVDTDYILWLNGKFVNMGQFSDLPKEKHYDILDVTKFLSPGKNVLAVLAYYQGVGTAKYAKGKAGLIFSLCNGTNTIVSNSLCSVRTSIAYQNGPMPLVTKQLGPTICYNASRDDGWHAVDYDDSKWPAAIELAGPTDGYWESLLPRPLPKLLLRHIRGTVVDCGNLRVTKTGGTVAMEMSLTELISESSSALASAAAVNNMTDCCLDPPSAIYDGRFILFDLGEENAGYFEIELDATAGTIVDIAHGEHIYDGRVRCRIKDRNFADRYICGTGRQKFLMIRRLGCRYIELHLKNFSSPVKIYNVGLLQASYPIKTKTSFVCSDPLHEKIARVALKTALLCMHEHYEDTPWREQALYAMDARNQALCGYYLFGNYDFPAVSLRLLGKTMSQDGYLDICSPSNVPITIPSFSMVWISAVRDHLLYSGDIEITREFWPQIKFMLDKYLSEIDNSGLMATPRGQRYWNFYEWSEALLGEDIDNGHYNLDLLHHSCLNLFLVEALNAAWQLSQYIEDSDGLRFKNAAEKLQLEIRKLYLDNNFMLLSDCVQDSHSSGYSQLTQAMALCWDIFPPHDAEIGRRKLLNNKMLVPATLSMLSYVYNALAKDSNTCGEAVLENIKSIWGHMIDTGSMTFWETIKGAADFGGAGSLCHGWSIIPIYTYYAHVLGIKPASPGFQKFTIAPAACGLSSADGLVPTPKGLIKTSWQLDGNKYRLTVDFPEVLQPQIDVPGDMWVVKLNPQKVNPKLKSSRQNCRTVDVNYERANG